MRSSLSDGAWHDLAEEAWTGLAEWRRQHPAATLAEIEEAVDERLTDLRTRLVRDAALASARADPMASGERPSCPECGTPMRLEGVRTRRLRTRHDRDRDLPRTYARCPACGTGVFPPG
jgi:ribosomal protein S27AE